MADESPRSDATTGSSPLPPYELFEVWCRLTTRRQGIRIRATSPESATREVLSHRPGWTLESVTRWAGEGWVAA